MVEGFPCGRARLWLPDGRLQRECFYVDLISLSPAAYARAQKLDPTLPQYPELNRKGYRQKRRISERHLEDLFIRSLLEEPGIVEARRWLDHEGKKPGLKYSLGRFSSRRAALKFVEAAYGAGATRVWVPKTLLDKQGNKFADVLLVGLPTDPKARRKLRAVCGIVLTKVLGSITPKKDRGEKWILIGMW